MSTQKWKDEHKEEMRAWNRAYIARRRAEDPKGYREADRIWRAKNRPKCREYERKYRAARLEEHKARATKRLVNNPSARIATRLRNNLYTALKGIRKGAPVLPLLGCSIDELKGHLARRFQLGMTFFNYGLIWQIHHIKACGTFDLTDPEQQRICFHHSNLMPLFTAQNSFRGTR